MPSHDEALTDDPMVAMIVADDCARSDLTDRDLGDDGDVPVIIVFFLLCQITLLHNDLEKVKADQQRLEHECDYIVAQQRELEDILSPLEDACKTQEGSLYRQHTDVERERTYQMSENIDSQLKRMVQDLKEIIDHMNTSNTTMDQTDPVSSFFKGADQRPSCQADQFRCISGTMPCIPIDLLCNGLPECSDGSDELECV
eukprot:XP_011664496.1 PREDICTED: nuclear pore glycoprotein p62 [Strongylocentrotus purpuratus]